MNIAQRMKAIPPSPTLAITAKAKAMAASGVDVVSFGAGEPDFDTPDFIKDAAKRALDAGETNYTPVPGTNALREAGALYLQRHCGLTYEANQLIFSCGGKHSLYNVFMCLLDPGDEVIIPSPYWVSYPVQVQLAQGVSVHIETTGATGFKITPAQLEAAITPKTKAFVLNSPSNPTGAGYTPAETAALANVLRRHPHVTIISDDIYFKLTYDGFEFVEIATLGEEMKARTVVVNGLSKTYAMTGWRLGFVASCNSALNNAMSSLQSQSTSNVTSFAQAAAIEALSSDDSFLVPRLAKFAERRKLIVDGLNAINGVHCNWPDGAFYVFPDVSTICQRRLGGQRLGTDLALTDYLLERGVAVVPGIAFGAEGHLRLSYATGNEEIEKGLDRIKTAFDSLD